MPVEITTEVKHLVEAIYRDGNFADETAVLTEALRVYRRRQQLVADVNAGVAQLDRGEGVAAEEVFERLQKKAQQLGVNAGNSTSPKAP
jgi:predicted transcriptional regulator